MNTPLNWQCPRDESLKMFRKEDCDGKKIDEKNIFCRDCSGPKRIKKTKEKPVDKPVDSVDKLKENIMKKAILSKRCPDCNDLTIPRNVERCEPCQRLHDARERGKMVEQVMDDVLKSDENYEASWKMAKANREKLQKDLENMNLQIRAYEQIEAGYEVLKDLK